MLHTKKRISMKKSRQNRVLSITEEALQALKTVKEHGEFRNYSVAIIRAVKAYSERAKK